MKSVDSFAPTTTDDPTIPASTGINNINLDEPTIPASTGIYNINIKTGGLKQEVLRSFVWRDRAIQ